MRNCIITADVYTGKKLYLLDSRTQNLWMVHVFNNDLSISAIDQLEDVEEIRRNAELVIEERIVYFENDRTYFKTVFKGEDRTLELEPFNEPFFI